MDVNSSISTPGKDTASYVYEFNPEQFSIRVKGKASDLNTLSAASLGLTLDLTGLGVGEYRIPLEFTSIDSEKFTVIGEYVYSVTISANTTPTPDITATPEPPTPTPEPPSPTEEPSPEPTPFHRSPQKRRPQNHELRRPDESERLLYCTLLLFLGKDQIDHSSVAVDAVVDIHDGEICIVHAAGEFTADRLVLLPEIAFLQTVEPDSACGIGGNFSPAFLII